MTQTVTTIKHQHRKQKSRAMLHIV